MEVGRHHGTMVNEHMMVGSHLDEKVKIFEYFGFLLTNIKLYSRGNKM